MNPKQTGRKAADPFANLRAPGTMVPNNPDNGRGLMQAIDAVEGPEGPTIVRRTYYGDAMAGLPDAPAFMTVPTQTTLGMEAPTARGLGMMSGSLPMGFAGGNPMDKQRGMSTSPSMVPGAGPRRNEPPPKQA